MAKSDSKGKASCILQAASKMSKAKKPRSFPDRLPPEQREVFEYLKQKIKETGQDKASVAKAFLEEFKIDSSFETVRKYL